MSEINPPASPNFAQPRHKVSPSILWSLLLVAGLGAAILVKQKISVGAAPPTQLNQTQLTAVVTSQPRGFLSQLKTFIFNPERTLKGEAEDRVNILLLGIGGKGHNGPDLTDTIILLSLKPSTNQLAVISIPRDLSVPIPGFDWRKINSANAYGEARGAGTGGQAASQIVASIFKLPIHYYVRVDFAAFEKIVDELDGIRINVDRAFIDKAYPTPDDKTTALAFEGGWQTMNGQRALQYARSRHGDNGEASDFARNKRQQKIILALKEKIFSLYILANPNHLFNLAEILQEHINTNLALWEAQRLFSLAKKINFDTVITKIFDDSATGLLKITLVNEASLLEPRGDSFEPLAQAVANIFNQGAESGATAPTDKKIARPLIEIQNGTWTLGLGVKTKAELAEAGITTAHVTNAASRSIEETIIYDLSRGAYKNTVVKIQDLLKIKATTAPPPSPLAPETKADILIIVGKDRAS